MEIDRLHGREEHFDAFTDLLFYALLGFAFMFFIAFLLINPRQQTGAVDVKAEFIIRVNWPATTQRLIASIRDATASASRFARRVYAQCLAMAKLKM